MPIIKNGAQVHAIRWGSQVIGQVFLGGEQVFEPSLPPGIHFVGAKTFNYGAQGSGPPPVPFDFTGLSGGLATHPKAGDYVLILAATGSNTSAPPVASFATAPALSSLLVLASNTQIDIRTCGLRVWEGYYTSAAAAGGAMTGLNTQTGAVIILVFRQCAGLDVPVVLAGGSSSGLPNPPEVTPVTTGAWVVAVGCNGSDIAGDPTMTDPTDLTYVSKIGKSGSGRTASIMSGLKTDWTSGAFDPAAFVSFTSGNFCWRAVTLALKPA